MILVGVDEISSFTDGTTRAGIAEALYPQIRDMALTMYPWTFSLKKVDLQESATSPVNEFDRSYSMPSDRLNGLPPAVFFSSGRGAAAPTDGWRLF